MAKLSLSVKRAKIFSLCILVMLMPLVFCGVLFGISEALIIVPYFTALLFISPVHIGDYLGGLITGGISAALIRAGVIQFRLFAQADVLYQINQDVLFWIKSSNPHAVRLLVAYPGILLSSALSVSVTEGMTIYSMSLMLLIILMANYILRSGRRSAFGKKRNGVSIRCILCDVSLLILSVVINGRLIFAYFGVILMLFCEKRYMARQCSLMTLQFVTLVAVFFCSVSSGTMMVLTFYAVLIQFSRRKSIRSKKEKLRFLMTITAGSVVILYIYVPYMFFFVQKNISYFGGLYQMLNHGMGRFFYFHNPVMVVSVLFSGAIFFLTNLYLFRTKIVKSNNPDLPFYLVINISLYGMLFGISTGTLGLIPCIILILSHFRFSFSEPV